MITGTGPTNLAVVQPLKAMVVARTMAVDPATHDIYPTAPTPTFRVPVLGQKK